MGRWRAFAVAILMIVTLGAAQAPKASFEVWLLDQSDTNGLAYGGTVHIFRGHSSGERSAAGTIDLATATASMCAASTGRNPVRPHMIVFNKTGSHAAISFVASGHVVIFNAGTRQPLACFAAETGTGGARQAHALWPTEDDRYLVIANQNGKKLERIRTDYVNGTFAQEPAATLDLAGCTTPNGAPCESAELRPDNAPICPFIASDNGPVFVSLRGGGLLMVDWRTTPMSIVAEYDKEHIPANGCGFAEAKGTVFGDGGGGTAHNLDQFSVFRMPMKGYSAANPPNVPAVQRLFDDDAHDRDAHGTAVTKNERFVWVGDRDGNVIEVFDGRTGARVGTIDLVSPFSADPTVDLFAVSPDRKWIFASTRGPTPLSGDPHSSHGTDPGLLIIKVTQGGRSGEVAGLLPITNLDATGIERADSHGIRLRPLA
ncbi:beta-propeller fold lactonase family protein [Streptosporangium soli]|nr:hypothetical protein [Streptosporangium sp. KLBMP 9127]